jgi:parallel beta-helix repeat protein
MKRSFGVLVPVLVMFLLAAGGAFIPPVEESAAPEPSVLFVGEGGFHTVQDAIAAARDYDIVQLGPGVYGDPIVIDKPITLQGMGVQSLITSTQIVTANNVVLKDNIYRNVFNNGSTYKWDEAGIITRQTTGVASNSYITGLQVSNCIFQNCQQGIFLFGAKNSVIDNCKFYGGVRGITVRPHYIGTSPTWSANGNTIKNCEFYDMAGSGIYDGEGIAIQDSTSNVVESCKFDGNWYGVAVSGAGGNTVRDCTITNSRFYPVSLTSVSGSTTTVSGNTISDNGQGMMFRTSSSFTVSSNTISGDGGPIDVDRCASFTITSNTIDGCSIYLNTSSAGVLERNEFDVTSVPALAFRATSASHWSHTIRDTNLIGTNPIYYSYNVPQATVDQKTAGAIILAYCNQAKVTNCTVADGDGVMVVGSDGFRVSDTTVDDCLYGLNVSSVSSGIFERTSVNSSTRGWDALHADAVTGVEVRDGAIDAPGTAPAWRLTGSSTVHSINTTFNGTDVEVTQAGGGTLKVWNFLTVKVWDEGRTVPLDGAHVDIVEDTTALYRTPHFGGANPVTDASGVIGPIKCLDREYVSDNTATEHNHYAKVWASIDAEWSDEALDLDMSHPRLVEFEAADIRAPSIPSNLLATDAPAEDAITVSWDANADDTVDYSVFWNASGTWALIQNVSVPGISLHVASGLVHGVTYWFAVSAWDEVPLESPWTAFVSVVHSDGLAPAAPTGLRAVEVNGTSLTLGWDANTDLDLTGYRVYMNQSGAGSNGPWQLLTSAAGITATGLWVQDMLSETAYHFVVTALDEVPNESPLSLVLTVTTLDITPPEAPTLDELVEYTNQATLAVTGVAEPGSTVTVFVGGTPAGTGQAGADGTFSVDVQLSNGANVITAWATDAADNTGPLSAEAGIILDRDPPAAPELDPLPELTNVVTLTVTGRAEALSTVRILVNGEPVTTTPAAADGAFSVDIDLAEGDNAITTIAIDRALNEGPASVARHVVLDTIAPAPPDISATPEYTNDETPDISGTTEAGAKVEILSGTTVLATVDADDAGTFTTTITLSGRETVIRARATDPAGNVGDLGDSRSIILDTTPPTANAGADVSAIEEEGIALDGSASTDDEGIANYTWTFAVGANQVTLYGAKVTHTFADPITLTATLKVTDLAGNVGTDTVDVAIRAKNLPPILRGGKLDPGTGGDTGTNFKFEVIYEDADGDQGEVWVYIDNASYLMTPDPDDTNTVDGRKYTYTTKLTEGPHAYYFRGSDSFGNEAGGESAGPGTSKATGDISKKKVKKSPGFESVLAVAALAAALVAVGARRRR